MTNNKLWKRVTAGALALMIAAGTAPAGFDLTEIADGFSIFASAEEEAVSFKKTDFRGLEILGGGCKYEQVSQWANDHSDDIFGDYNTKLNTLTTQAEKLLSDLSVDIERMDNALKNMPEDYKDEVFANSARSYYTKAQNAYNNKQFESFVYNIGEVGNRVYYACKYCNDAAGDNYDKVSEYTSPAIEDALKCMDSLDPLRDYASEISNLNNSPIILVYGTMDSSGTTEYSVLKSYYRPERQGTWGYDAYYPSSLEELYNSENGCTLYCYDSTFGKTSLAKANVIVSTEYKTVTVRLDGGLIDKDNYDVTFEGVDNNYTGKDFPDAAGTYKAKVTGKGDFIDSAESDQFTVVTYEKVEAKPATVNETGNSEYYKGSDEKFYELTDDNTYSEIEEDSWIIDKIGVEKVEAKPATVNETGNTEYYKGKDEKFYELTDDNTYSEIEEDSWIIDKIGVEKVEAKPATVNDEGNIEYYKGIDGKFYVYNPETELYDEITEGSWVISVIELTAVEAKDPTYTAPGNIEYCIDDDGNIYLMKDGKYVPATEKEVTLAQLVLDHVDAAEPTYEADGNIEYWYDPTLDKYFLDDKGETEITYDDTVIPALKPDYKPSWKWAADYSTATLTLIDKNGGDPVVIEAVITETRVESTCKTQGKISYIATASYNNTNYSYTKTVKLPLGDHTYGEPEWQWIDENTVKATFTCTECGESKTVDATVESEETAPTTTAYGKIVYTASVTIGGKTYLDSRTVKLDKLPAAPTVTYTPGTNSAKLEWTAVDGAEKYAVCSEVNGKWQIIGKGKDTTFALKDLTTGKKYKIAVLAKVNGEWIEDYSKAIIVTPKAAANYPKVTSIIYNEKYHQFRLNWDAVDGAEKYGIAVFIANKWNIVTQDIPANTTNFTSPKLKAGQTYRMVVCAKIGGKWDTNNLASRAFSVTVK